MLAVPAPLSLLLLAFSLVANDPSLLSCPISIIERLQRLSFQGVVSDMAFSHSRPVDCILPEQTQRPIVPITTHFSNCLSYLLLLSSSPCHFSLQNVSSALSLFEVLALWREIRKTKITQPCWESSSADVNTHLQSTSVFQRHSLGGPWRRWGQFSGFLSKPRAETHTSHHAVRLSEMAKHLEPKALFSLYPPVGLLFEVKAVKRRHCFGPFENVTVHSFYAGYAHHPALRIYTYKPTQVHANQPQHLL